MSQLVAMMMRANVLTASQAQEARAHQVVYGDRIGTNLLDLGVVDETLLAQALGALHNVPYAAGPTADTGPTLARALSASAAARLNAVPARWDGNVMHVFMMEPRNSRAIGELEQLLKRRVSPVVVVEARMWELLRKHYKVRRGLRALALDGDPLARAQQLLKQATQKPPAPPPTISVTGVVAPGVAAATAAHVSEELSSEEDFNAIYQRSAVGGTMTGTERAVAQAEAAQARRTQSSDAIAAVVSPPAAPTPRPSLSDAPVISGTLLLDNGPPAGTAPVTGVVVDGTPVDPIPVHAARPDVTPPSAQAGGMVWRTTPLTPAPPPTTAAAPSAPSQPSSWPAQQAGPPVSPVVAPPVVSTPVAAALASAAGTSPVVAFTPATEVPDFGVPMSQVGVVPEPPATDEISLEIDIEDAAAREPPPTTPLTFAQAREALAGVEDRNAIARTVLRYALTPFKRAVLLTVQKDLILGWDALGDGVSQEAVERVILPLQQPSIFRLAFEARAHYLGPVPKQPVNYLFLKLLGGKVPRSAFVIPVVVRGKVVNLLYCDNGGGQDATLDVGELLILAQHINRSYEALLKKAA
jgi:hypothetical protein